MDAHAVEGVRPSPLRHDADDVAVDQVDRYVPMPVGLIGGRLVRVEQRPVQAIELADCDAALPAREMSGVRTGRRGLPEMRP
jgi:hypothetical protein